MSRQLETIPVPLLDINGENAPLLEEIGRAIADVCRSGWFILGPEVQKLEQNVAGLVGANHAIGCASGSEALLMAMMALDIGPGDEVIVPSFTFFATASAVCRVGAKIVFADIQPDSFNIDPVKIDEAVTPRTRAIIPVHLYGQPADMSAIMATAERHGLAVVEDVAQAIGSRYFDRGTGSIGDIGCFSFYPTKNLGGLGDGGLMTTNDKQLADKLGLLRGHGMQPRYYHQIVGINGRIDAIQAVALNVKFRHLDQWNTARRENAARYQSLFKQAGLLDGRIAASQEMPGCYHVWNQYSIRVMDGRRDSLRKYLTDQKIGTEVFYPVPLHLQQCFESLGYKSGDLPETERATREVLCLPIFPLLTAVQQEQVVETITDFYRQ